MVKPTQQKELQNAYGKETQYILQKDLVLEGQRTIKKGSKVKAFLRFDKSWIKVYVYSAEENRLNAIPVLALFITKEELGEKAFIEAMFKEKFNQIFSAPGSGLPKNKR